MRGLLIPEKHYEDTVGGIMALKADSFIVALRGDIDLTHLNGQVKDRQIKAFIHSSDISSTMIRNAIKEDKDFEMFVSSQVAVIIKL